MYKYNILYIVDKKQYLIKMSRVRFHGIQAIAKISNLTIWGPGWDGYDDKLPVQNNIDWIQNKNKFKLDLVIAFKPLELIEFAKINITKCIRYNEMYDFNWTTKEIEESNADLVICHHENDMQTYIAYYNNYHGQQNRKVKFFYNGHCAEKTIFKDYDLPKKYDILLVGQKGSRNKLKVPHYPLRDKFFSLIEKIPKKYTVGYYKHPGYFHDDAHTNKYLIEFAQAINSAKICVTCTGRPKSRFGKYIEIPMTNTAIAGDIPDQETDKEDFEKFVIKLDINMTDQEIIDKIIYYLENENELDKIRKIGKKWSKKYTQEEYAKRFINILNQFFQKL